MMEKELQKKINDTDEMGLPKYIERESPINTAEMMVSSIVGARRAGKSFRAVQAAVELTAGLPESAKRICHLDFDNPVLSGMTPSDLGLIETVFLKTRPMFGLKDRLVFIFDEIHRVPGWADYLIALSRNPNWKVIATGSSSSIMKNDLPAALRGKSFSTTVMPLSFREFLAFNGVETPIASTKGQAEIRTLFEQFLAWGGFPAIPKIEPNMKEQLLREYFDAMLLKDIIQKNNASKPVQLTSLMHYLLSNIGRPNTVSAMLNYMKQSGFKTNRDYISEYVSWAEDCWMLFSAPLFTDSQKELEHNYKKFYCIDWALAVCNSRVWDGSYSRAFENMIYIELLRRYRRVGYYLTRSKRQEVDFIATGATGKPELAVQVCMDTTFESVLKRELEPLVAASKYFGIKDCLLITMSKEGTTELSGVTIRMIPAWTWMLERQ
ncbi:MAG: ATP-binding protein [Myxococcota bacterium]|jgi:hypothetical protein